MTRKKVRKKTAKKTSSRKSVRTSRRQGSANSQSRKLTHRKFLPAWLNRISFGWSMVVFILIASAYLIWLDYRVIDRFTGRIWSLPARVYARPLELYEGKKLTVDELLFELNNLDYVSINTPPSRPGRYHHWDDHFEIKTRAFQFWDGKEESHAIRVDIDGDTVSGLYDLYTQKDVSLIRLDPAYITGIFPSHGEDRILVKLGDTPEIFREMLIMVEDRRFYEHHGVDLKSIARALVANIKAGKTVQGGSTITQQLVKNMFLTSDRNLWRKINEALMSIMLELHYDKQQILETYLNEVYLGQDSERAIHGFGLASDFYFGKAITELDLDQMATLIGMVKGASYYNPVRNPERSTQRRNVVLDVVQEQGLISPQQAALQKQKQLVVTSRSNRARYPAFVNLVKRQLVRDYAADDLKSEGLLIYTTLDPYVQHQTEEAIINWIPALDWNKEGLQAAAVVVSPDNGEVLAIVGDSNPSYSGFNRALDAQRHIGSLIKPVVYLAAVTHKDRYTLGSVLSDTRLRIQGEDKKIWEPENYDKEFHGDVIMYEALLKSYNIPAARLGLELGLADITSTLRKLGSDKVIPPYPSVTLGAFDMSPFEMARVYQTFAANGFNSSLRSVNAVLDAHANPLQRYELDVNRDTDPAAISLINFVLHNVTRSGTAKRLAEELDFDVAGKTGTSDDLNDSWFAGFSGDKLGIVWVGFDDHRTTGLTGSSGAMRIWSQLFKSISTTPFKVDMPANVHMVWVDRESGLLSDKGCENAVELPFIKGSEPDESSTCAPRGSPLDWLKNIFK